MILPGEAIFVDSGAWIALEEIQDPLHPRAVTCWEETGRQGARLFSSVPVIIETFTFLDRQGSHDLALRWKASLAGVERFEILGCGAAELAKAWAYLDHRKFHKLSLVDATSFVLMEKHHIRAAFTFDTHFALAGFRCVG